MSNLNSNDESALHQEMKRKEQQQNDLKSADKKSMPETSKQSDVEQINTAPMGFINLDVENLPSEGLFYPEGTQFSIRAANTAEVRHWSSIDESNPLSLNEHLNEIVSKCTRVICNGNSLSWVNILEMDRLYLILSIRDLTFKQGDNNIALNLEDPSTGESEKVELNNNNLTYKGFPDELMEYYNPDKRTVSFKIGDESIQMAPPTLGIGKKVSNFIKEQRENNSHIDRTFIQKFPFMNHDYRKLNDEFLKKEQFASKQWSIDKISAVDYFTKLFQEAVQPKIYHEFSSGEEVTADVRFPNGVKSLFLISDITGKISKD